MAALVLRHASIVEGRCTAAVSGIQVTRHGYIQAMLLCRAGTAALVARRASIANAYDAMAVGGYLRASGVEGASYSFSRGDAATETRWTLP